MSIGFNKAENLFVFARRYQFPKIHAELERIGIKNIMVMMSPEKQRQLIDYMYSNKPAEALILLERYPSGKEA
jgi:hypothetical protein